MCTLLSHDHSQLPMDYCNECLQDSLERPYKFKLVQNSVAGVINGVPGHAQVISLFCKLYWHPVCFWVQIRVLVVTLKAIYGMGLNYLWGQLAWIATYSFGESETELNRVEQNY